MQWWSRFLAAVAETKIPKRLLFAWDIQYLRPKEEPYGSSRIPLSMYALSSCFWDPCNKWDLNENHCCDCYLYPPRPVAQLASARIHRFLRVSQVHSIRSQNLRAGCHGWHWGRKVARGQPLGAFCPWYVIIFWMASPDSCYSQICHALAWRSSV